jgi:hypothetical protein
MKTKTLKWLLLPVAVLGMLACQNETLEDEHVILESIPVIDDHLLTAKTVCGSSANRDILGDAEDLQGTSTLCKIGETSDNPGLLDCRIATRGEHKKSGDWFIYDITQGNKTKNNTTSVRIERGFKNFKRQKDPGKGKKAKAFKATFKGRVRIDRLPNKKEAKGKPVDYKNDYTYIIQMHGSGKVRNFATKEYNDKKHTSAIWLLRAHRTSETQFKFSIEYSTKPAVSGVNPDRKTVDVATKLDIGKEFDIEINYGYDANRKFDGYIKAAGKKKDVPDIKFQTDEQYFRYGAYRAGPKKSPTATNTTHNRAIIAWKKELTFCNPG